MVYAAVSKVNIFDAVVKISYRGTSEIVLKLIIHVMHVVLHINVDF